MSKKVTKQAKDIKTIADKFELSDDEIFDAYTTFALFLAVNLKKIRKCALGVPGQLCRTKDGGIGSAEKGMKRWHKKLDKMIWAFDEYAKGMPNEPSYFDEKTGKVSVEYKKYRNRLNKGLDLFARWFEWLAVY